MRAPDRSKPSVADRAWHWAISVPEMAWVAARIIALEARHRRLCPVDEASEKLGKIGVDLNAAQIRMIYKRHKIYTEKEKRFRFGQMRWVRLVDPKELAHYAGLSYPERLKQRPWMSNGYLEGFKWNTKVGISRTTAGYG